MKLEEYVKCFTGSTAASVTGLCGRIIRGTKPEDFWTLTDDPDRKLVMLMGPDGLEKLLGKSGYDMLIEIGYERDYIKRKVDEGNQFKLVVFQEGGDALLATWRNVIDVVSKVYPDIAGILNYYYGFTTVPFDVIEERSGFDFSEIDKAGSAHPSFMTHEKMINSGGGLINARAFLYFTIHLRELFSGDGYTYTADGKKGLMEYIVPNKKLVDLGEHALLKIEL